MDPIKLDAGNGSLHLRTDTAGAAAKMGHRLLLEVSQWDATIEFAADVPVSVTLTAQLASLAVVSGEGGVKALAPGDDKTILEGAAKSLNSAKYPQVDFVSSAVTGHEGGYTVAGNLRIAGRTEAIAADVSVAEQADHWQVATRVAVQQTRFGIKPFATMLGQLKVADVVQVELEAKIAK